MEVFATFDVINDKGEKVAEGHKASFCLEDNLCKDGVQPRYACANYGDQGFRVWLYLMNQYLIHDFFISFYSFVEKRYFCWLL